MYTNLPFKMLVVRADGVFQLPQNTLMWGPPMRMMKKNFRKFNRRLLFVLSNRSVNNLLVGIEMTTMKILTRRKRKRKRKTLMRMIDKSLPEEMKMTFLSTRRRLSHLADLCCGTLRDLTRDCKSLEKRMSKAQQLG